MPATPDQSAGRGGPAPDPRALASLLGTTRAQVLQQIANMAPATTNGVAGALEVSAATVSHHTGVLSRSRLITTRRDGASVRHMLTPLGRSLLRAHGLPAAPSAPPMVWAGDLACTRYTSGQRLFDLPDRCIPAPLLNDHLDDDTCLTRLLENAATVLGIATAADFADYVRIRAATAQRLLPHTALTPVAVQGWGWGPAFAHPRALNMPQAAPREPVFLNPFDNLIWHRPRVQ
ncbi:hypothetical protein GT350_02855, partial [Streptomyces sp. SID1034]|nr:hypothetical protein [Streptomyces sp. SID1034]